MKKILLSLFLFASILVFVLTSHASNIFPTIYLLLKKDTSQTKSETPSTFDQVQLDMAKLN